MVDFPSGTDHVLTLARTGREAARTRRDDLVRTTTVQRSFNRAPRHLIGMIGPIARARGISGRRTRPRVPVNWMPERVCWNRQAPICDRMNLEFSGEMWFWKGPAPWHFITVPEQECGELEATSALVAHGWGMIPVTAQIEGTGWKTSLFPKDRAGEGVVRNAEGLEVGDIVTVRLAVDV